VAEAAEVRAALLRLRHAHPGLRERRDVVDVLGSLLDALAAPESTSRDALAGALAGETGFELRTVQAGLELALEEWTGDALRALLRDELGRTPTRRAAGFPTTAVLLAGAIPMPSLLSLLLPLAVGSPVLARPGRHDRVTAPFLAGELARLDPALAPCLEITGFPTHDEDALAAFLEADCVVVTGSDETVGRIEARIPPSRRLVRYGHRVSVAVIPIAAGDPRWPAVADGLALDVALWDQLGCLSPVAVYVVGRGGLVPEEIEQEMVRAFEAVEPRLPRGKLGAEAATAEAHERAEAELRAASDPALRLHCGAAWTLVCERDLRFRNAPLHRFVRVHAVADAAELQTALAPLSRHLAGVAFEPGESSPEPWLSALQRVGPSRICRPGRLQAPPLAWSHDGQGPLRPLVRFTDMEGDWKGGVGAVEPRGNRGR
jgi:hypothetical protein